MEERAEDPSSRIFFFKLFFLFFLFRRVSGCRRRQRGTAGALCRDLPASWAGPAGGARDPNRREALGGGRGGGFKGKENSFFKKKKFETEREDKCSNSFSLSVSLSKTKLPPLTLLRRCSTPSLRPSTSSTRRWRQEQQQRKKKEEEEWKTKPRPPSLCRAFC